MPRTRSATRRSGPGHEADTIIRDHFLDFVASVVLYYYYYCYCYYCYYYYCYYFYYYYYYYYYTH